MKTPQDKYLNDPQYRVFVDTVHALIKDAKFTPSEVREASVLACIHFEMNSMYRFQSVPVDVSEALETIHSYRTSEQKKAENEK